MHKGNRAKFHRAWQQMEALEQRQLLSNGVIDVTQGLPDLQVTIAPTFKTPSALLSGTGKIINLPVDITNIDRTTATGKTVAVPAGQKATIKVYARRETPAEGEADIEIGELLDVPLAGLAVNAKKSVKVPVNVNDDVGGGNWAIVVKLDVDEEVLELDESADDTELQANNVTQSALIPITMGRPDLSVLVNDSALPNSTQSGLGKIYRIPIRITNTGTLAVAKDKTVNVKITLNSTLVEDSYEFTTPLTVTVGGLRPGGSVSATAIVFFQNGVNTGSPFFDPDQQAFTFTVDPDNAIKELDEANDTNTKTVNVTFGAPALQFTPMANTTLPKKPVLSDPDRNITFSAKLTNIGNVPWISERFSSKVSYILAHESVEYIAPDAFPNAPEYDLELAPMNPGKSRIYKVTAILSRNLMAGNYHVYIREKFTDAEGVEQTVYHRVTQVPFPVLTGNINLQPKIVSTNLPKTVLSGDGKQYNATLSIKNAGTLSTKMGMTANVKFHIRNLAGDPIWSSDEQVVDLGIIGPKASKSFTLPLVIKEGAGEVLVNSPDYVIVAEITSSEGTEELILSDNTSPASKPFKLIKGLPDLAVTAANVHLPDTFLAGSGKSFNIPVTIKNVGNIKPKEGALITVKVMANDGAHDAEEVAKLTGIDVSKLAKNGTLRLTIPVAPDSELPSGEYAFTVEVDTEDTVEELDEFVNNRVIIAETMAVTQGLPDLAGSINGVDLAGVTQHAGDGTVVTVPFTLQNLGTLATAKGQLLSIRLFVVPEAGGEEVDVATIKDIKIGGLKAGGTKLLNLKTALPIELLNGGYQLRAEIDPDGEVDELGDTSEENAANNTFAGPTLTVQRIGPDLKVEFPESLDLPTPLVSGDGTKFTLPMTITNAGGAVVPKNAKIKIVIMAHNQADGDDKTKDVAVTELVGVKVGGLAAGASTTLGPEITLPAGIGPGKIVLTVMLDSEEVLPELDELVSNFASTGPLAATAPLP